MYIVLTGVCNFLDPLPPDASLAAERGSRTAPEITFIESAEGLLP